MCDFFFIEYIEWEGQAYFYIEYSVDIQKGLSQSVVRLLWYLSPRSEARNAGVNNQSWGTIPLQASRSAPSALGFAPGFCGWQNLCMDTQIYLCVLLLPQPVSEIIAVQGNYKLGAEPAEN